MEAIPVIIIVAPVVMPVLAHYQIDPVHFGILLSINMAIGANTPPVGVDLMAACKIGGINMMQTLRPLSWMMMAMTNRKSVVEGKSVSVRVDSGGSRIM